MAVKPWTTGYPAAVDSISTMPVLIDLADDVIASHPIALRDAVISLQVENSTYRDNIVITAGSNIVASTVDVEQVIGTALFDGVSTTTTLIPHLRMLGSYTPDGAAAATLRLYDLGTTTTPIDPVLRASVSVTDTVGDITYFQQVLTISASPVGANQVHNAPRLYEFRVFIPTGGTAPYIQVGWVGFALGNTQ
jgi:hypothetical protein